MPLGDIEEKLYKKDAPQDLSKHEASEYDPDSHKAGEGSTKATVEDLWSKKNKGLGLEEKKVIKKGVIALGIVLFLILALVIVYQVRRISFSETEAGVSISGPEQARSGKLLTYEFNYSNNNWVAIEDTVLKISYPDNFKPEDNPGFLEDSPTSGHFDLGSIKRKSEKKIVFNGRAYGPKGAFIHMKANLSYRPTGYTGRFESNNQLGINVISSPIVLEIQGPQNVSSGDEVNYLVSYRNDGAEDFSGLKIKIEYPQGFSFSASDPAVFENDNIWYVGNVSSGQEGKITVKGKLSGEKDEIKIAKIFIGTENSSGFESYNEESVQTKIVASPFAIWQTVNGNSDYTANVGDNLEFELVYRNNGDIGLRDVIVREKLEGDVLDYSTLKIEGGSFDLKEKTITWKASGIKNLTNLDPGQEGKIGFSIQVKKNIEIKSSNDKNFVISSVAKIDSPDIATPISMNKVISGNKIDIKLNSKLILDAKGYYTDPNIPNSGPIPPKVGEETTYVIHWFVSSVSNDLENAKVEASLSPGTQMTGAVFPDGVQINYNERTNLISWNIGNISAGTGVLSSPKEVSFQIKIKPSPDQVGQEVNLMSESKLTVKDSFTGEDLKKSADKKTTRLPEDSSVGSSNHKVIN